MAIAWMTVTVLAMAKFDGESLSTPPNFLGSVVFWPIIGILLAFWPTLNDPVDIAALSSMLKDMG